MPSLTRIEAAERARTITVAGYTAHLDLTGGERSFDSTSTITFTASGPATFVDVKARRLLSATLNGQSLDVSGYSPEVGRLPLRDLQARNELVIEAEMAYSHDGEGLHRTVDVADGRPYVYAMSFLDAAPRWFACFDQPDLKAPFTLRVSCPPEWTVAGNAPAVPIGPGRWELVTTEPVATYFTTLIAGPYRTVRDTHDGIPLAIHARASLAEHLEREAPEILAITKDCLDEFHRLFGVRYPWGEYHQAFVPEFNAGAMENPGCVTFRDTFVFRSRVTDAERGNRASTIAHEMAHMWFGDLVTMRWWDDLWLNESFAEYLGQRVSHAVTRFPSWVNFGAARKAWGHRADRRPSTHPVAGNGAADAASALGDFDGISYAKGASVLKQLAAHIGDEAFLAGLRRHFAGHAFGNAEFADLIEAWTAAGARDLPAWADAWLRTAGLDTLRFRDGALRRDPDGDQRRPHAVEVAGFDAAGHESTREPATLLTDESRLPGASGALVLPDAADATWAKIAFDPATWAAMPELLPPIAAATPRVVIWNALRLAVADAEVDPALALDIVEAAVASESADVVLSQILAWATDELAGHYLAGDAARDAALDRLSATAQRALRAADPGSGLQLAAFRAQVQASRHPDRLRSWLDGSDLPAELLIDAELRWAIVTRLAALGALDAAEIEAELDRDRSAQGAVHAAACRAVRPDSAAKAAAWQLIMGDPDVSNYELYATARAFWHPEQAALTAPYAPEYFEQIESAAKLRSGWVIGELAELAYPSTAISAQTLRSTEELLARPGVDPNLRRAVVDAGDDLRRALTSRLRFS